MATKRRSTRKAGTRSKTGPRRGPTKTRRWSKRVMETSDALDLEEGVFSKRSPRQIALSLKRSAERSKRRKSEPFRSAMSMLTFHMNRAGRQLTPERKKVLMQAKVELRKAFER